MLLIHDSKLDERRRAVRQGGPLAPLYELYSFQILPRLGEWLAGDAASYRYLAESIRRHPDQETLKDMMQSAGFERCEYFNLTAGVVALHIGHRL